MNKQLFSLAMVLAAAMSAEGVLIFPGLEEPPPPPQERVEQIRREFLALKRPLDFTVKVKDGGWRGGDVSELMLRGATARFAEKYSNVELVHALWPMLDDPKTDADASIVLFGKIAPSSHGRHFTNYRSPQQPSDWEERRKDDIRICKLKCRAVVGQGGNPFWKPHPILFQYDYEKFRAMADKPGERTEWIGKLRGWLRDPEVIANNPLEVYKIICTLTALSEKEVPPELFNLILYDWRTGQSYRFRRSDYPQENIHSGNELSYAAGSMNSFCTVMMYMTSALPLDDFGMILDWYVATTDEDRALGEGGGNAAALIVQFCFRAGSGFTQVETVEAIQEYKRTGQTLSSGQSQILDELCNIIQSGKYQQESYFLSQNWFGKLPFSRQVLSNGDIVGGYRIGESFFSFWSHGLLGTVDGAWLAAHPDQVMEEKVLHGAKLGKSREEEYQAFREKTLLLFTGHLVTNRLRAKAAYMRNWYETKD